MLLIAVVVEWHSFPESVAWPVAMRLLFRWGGLLAATSLSSAEVEELELTGVFEDEAGCMGLIFWLSGVGVQTSYVFQHTG